MLSLSHLLFSLTLSLYAALLSHSPLAADSGGHGGRQAEGSAGSSRWLSGGRSARRLTTGGGAATMGAGRQGGDSRPLAIWWQAQGEAERSRAGAAPRWRESDLHARTHATAATATTRRRWTRVARARQQRIRAPPARRRRRRQPDGIAALCALAPPDLCRLTDSDGRSGAADPQQVHATIRATAGGFLWF